MGMPVGTSKPTATPAAHAAHDPLPGGRLAEGDSMLEPRKIPGILASIGEVAVPAAAGYHTTTSSRPEALPRRAVFPGTLMRA